MTLTLDATDMADGSEAIEDVAAEALADDMAEAVGEEAFAAKTGEIIGDAVGAAFEKEEPFRDSDDARQNYIDRIAVARLKVRKAEEAYETAKETAKECRKDFDAANKDLGKIIDAGPERLPLFDGPETPDEPAALVNPREDPASPKDRVDEEAWRFVTTEEVGIPQGIRKVLTDTHNIETLGHIAEWCAVNELGDIKGLGQKKVEKIQEATDKYWAEHPQE